jgi:hypothetical protein
MEKYTKYFLTKVYYKFVQKNRYLYKYCVRISAREIDRLDFFLIIHGLKRLYISFFFPEIVGNHGHKFICMTFSMQSARIYFI